jgi:hypothetical protein
LQIDCKFLVKMERVKINEKSVVVVKEYVLDFWKERN